MHTRSTRRLYYFEPNSHPYSSRNVQIKKKITSRCFPRQTTHTYKCLFLIRSDISCCSTFTQVSSGWNSPDWPKYSCIQSVTYFFAQISPIHLKTNIKISKGNSLLLIMTSKRLKIILKCLDNWLINFKFL